MVILPTTERHWRSRRLNKNPFTDSTGRAAGSITNIAMRSVLYGVGLVLFVFSQSGCVSTQIVSPGIGRAMTDGFMSQIRKAKIPPAWNRLVDAFQEGTLPTETEYARAVAAVGEFLKEKGVNLSGNDGALTDAKGPFPGDEDPPFSEDAGDIVIRGPLGPFFPRDPKRFDVDHLLIAATRVSPPKGYELDYFMDFPMRKLFHAVVYWRKKGAPAIPTRRVLDYVLALKQSSYRSFSDAGHLVKEDDPLGFLDLVSLHTYSQEFYPPYLVRIDYHATQFFFSSKEISEFLRKQLTRVSDAYRSKDKGDRQRAEIMKSLGELRTTECRTLIRRTRNAIEVEVYRTTSRAEVIHETIFLTKKNL